MKITLPSEKQDLLKYGYILFLVLLSCHPVPFLVRLSYFETVPYAIGSLLIISLFFVFFKKVRITRDLGIILLIVFAHNILIYLKFGTIHPRFYLIYLSAILYAFIAIKISGHKLIKILENVLFTMVLISFPFYIWAFLSPDSLNQFLSVFTTEANEWGGSSTIFYVYRPKLPGHVMLRNCGFCWEPGMYAITLLLAITLNLIKNDFKLNGRILVYFVVLISTFSTTGYVSFIFVLIYYILNVKLRFAGLIIVAIVIVPLVIYVGQLDFISFKITEAMDQSVTYLIDQSLSAEEDEVIHPQRLASLRIRFVDFLNHPVFGYGGYSDGDWLHTVYGDRVNIYPVSGLGNFLASFGATGILLLIFAALKSSRLFAQYEVKYSFLIFLMLLTFFVSYRILDMAMFHMILLYFFIDEKGLGLQVEKDPPE